MANWKSPGLDMPVYWLKQLTALHLAVQFQNVIDNPDCLPAWMLSGKTSLILENAEKGPIASNYRPITCLPAIWKLLSRIIGSRGTKDQLLIDKMIIIVTVNQDQQT